MSFLQLIPTTAVFLAKSPIVKNYDLSSIIQVISGAAPLSKEAESELSQRLKLTSIGQGNLVNIVM